MSGICDICADYQNKFVTCKKCEFKACVKCTKTFILDASRPVRASCMSCKAEWTKKDLVDGFSVGFVLGAYKTHRETLLFEFEKALLPATIDYAYRIKRTRELNQSIVEYTTAIHVTNNQISKNSLEFNLSLLDEMHRLNKLRYAAEFELKQITIDGLRPSRSAASSSNSNKRYYPCITTDCRGFICMNSLKCDLCKIVVCEHCMESKPEEHKCNPETVDTIKMLKSDSKNCPKCMAFIYRISGCPQMFCTMCHTAFDWNTGNIVDRGVIHNPHYFEYLRTHQENAPIDEDVCGREISYTQMVRKYPESSRDAILPRIFQTIAHLEHVYLPNIRVVDQAHDRNRDLRVLYILQEISMQKFKSDLHKREKATEKKKEI